MRTMFERSFASGFGSSPMQGFRPMGPMKVKVMGRALGQDSEFSFDPEVAPSSSSSSSPYSSPFSFSPDYTPLAPTYEPSTFPSPAQSQSLPTERPPGTSDTDWAKILAEGFKAAASGYGVYSQAEIAKMKAQADLLRSKNPGAASILPGGMSATTTTLLVLGGVGLLGTLLVFALK